MTWVPVCVRHSAVVLLVGPVFMMTTSKCGMVRCFFLSGGRVICGWCKCWLLCLMTLFVICLMVCLIGMIC